MTANHQSKNPPQVLIQLKKYKAICRYSEKYISTVIGLINKE
jgi:hypothetical protein